MSLASVLLTLATRVGTEIKAVRAEVATGLSGKQAADQDLTDLAALTPTNNDLVQRKAGAWTNRTPAQVKTDLVLVKADVGLSNVDNTTDLTKPVSTAQQSAINTAIANLVNSAPGTLDTLGEIATQLASDESAAAALAITVGGKQAADQDLTDIAALTPANGDWLRRVSGVWSNVTTAALKTALALVAGDVGLGNVDNTSNTTERAATRTLTNARITKRIGTTASSGTPTADADSHDQYNVTALAVAATFGAPTGTPTDGQMLLYRIKDSGTARALGWNAVFRAVGATLPATTVISKTLYVGSTWNAADSKWDVIATAQEA